jgi:hypothetical protein
MGAETEKNHVNVMNSNRSSIVSIAFKECLALAFLIILGLLGLYLYPRLGTFLVECDWQYIHSPDEALRYLTGQYFRYSDGIADCTNYDSYDPKIKNGDHWKQYTNSALEVSFSYPPGADIKVSGNEIVVSNIRLEPQASLSDQITLTRYRFSPEQLEEFLCNPQGQLQFRYGKQIECDYWMTREEGKKEYGGWHCSPSAYDNFGNYLVWLNAPLVTDVCGTSTRVLAGKLQQAYPNQRFTVWEIRGSDSIPKEWGKVAPYCTDWCTPVSALLYSIKW